MTSVSELFYQRRSRVGRAVADLGIEPSISDRNLHRGSYNRRHHNNYNHHQEHQGRHDFDGFDRLRRLSPHVRDQPCHRLSSSSGSQERASVWLNQSTSQIVPSNVINTESLGSTSIQRLTRNERLPGTVLLARARLLERLRGVSLSENRRNGRASFGIYNREYTFGDGLRVREEADRGTDISSRRSGSDSPFTDSTLQMERIALEQDSSKKKPPGLAQEALEGLRLELFSHLEEGAKREVSLSLDCSICLESFVEGDELIRLPCEHRFHSICLDPWVRTCGDCPYCRRDIAVNGCPS
uniref:Uncharacterized protein LOC105108889 n=2 Tax=Rhizophora mucronata TaxID=61149 RepID=A0A2P2M5K0_RHIMU